MDVKYLFALLTGLMKAGMMMFYRIRMSHQWNNLSAGESLMSQNTQDARVAAIVQTIQDVEASPCSVRQYFREHVTPFGRAHYYHYKKTLKERGIQGLYDQRQKGNHTKLTSEMKSFIKGLCESARSIPSSDVRRAIQTEFGVLLSIRTIQDFRQEHGTTSTCPDVLVQESGASELAIALALTSGFIDTITDAIYQQVQQKRASEGFSESLSQPKDHPDLRASGKFTSVYNRDPAVSGARFQCLADKARTKRLASMKIFSHSRDVFKRYSLALFALPLVTGNGRVRSIDNPRGNALAYLCGYNYKAATLTKYLSELKYLQMSNALITVTAGFWIAFWSRRHQRKPGETLFVCYYLDGNTKALWSSKSCHKGKVTMLGRVMNCLEQVFIHDGQGHPIYFQTFNGHADLGKHVLSMMERIRGAIDETMDVETATRVSVNRILIFDGGGNGVRTLRGLCSSDYHFITILDANQVSERKLKTISQKTRYAYGEAWLADGVIELEDSHEKGYLFETRAVQVLWDNGRTAVLITSLSQEVFSPDHVVKSYFDRWPLQELNFKELKSQVNIHRVVGYGKKESDNLSVLEKTTQLQQQIQELEQALEEPLKAIRRLEETLAIRIEEERVYREKSQVVDGQRKLSQDDARRLQTIQRDIARLKRKIKSIEGKEGKLFPSLRKKRAELARIIDKKKIYRLDVELDQIMTCFKISFANICCYLLEECFNEEKMTLERLFETIFELRGQVRIDGEQRDICITRNPKQEVIMKKLEQAFEVVNHMKIVDMQGHRYHFTLV